MRIRIDRASAIPASTQLVKAIRTRIESGSSAPGERLPPVRELAGRLALAPNTVAKAYRELERDGYVQTRGRAGTFVATTLPAAPGDRSRLLDDAATAFVRRAHQLGASDADARAAFERASRSARAFPRS